MERTPRSGEFVGLGAGKAGNSEAGHSNLGAGRCVMQDDVRLDAAVKDGSFKKNPTFLQAIEHAKKNGTALHLLAYLTYKSSHGCIDYPLAICEMARDAGLDRVYFHIIFDGRSTEPGSAPTLLAGLDEKLDAIGVGRIRGRRGPRCGAGSGQELRQSEAGLRCHGRRRGYSVRISAADRRKQIGREPPEAPPALPAALRQRFRRLFVNFLKPAD